MDDAHITLQDVTVRYGSQRGDIEALQNVTLGIARGKFVAITGPSGCGKSTLLNLVAGLIPPSSGSLEITHKYDTHQDNERIGYIFQEPSLLPWRSVQANVQLPLEILGYNRRIAEARSKDLLSQVGLETFARVLPGTLSGGMKQRVAIARALALDPTILLMDEPFSALDELTRLQFIGQVQRFWSDRTRTVIFVTHNVLEAVFLADEVIVLSSRPGTIAMRVLVNSPRPRSHDFMSSAECFNLTSIIRKHLLAPLMS